MLYEKTARFILFYKPENIFFRISFDMKYCTLSTFLLQFIVSNFIQLKAEIGSIYLKGFHHFLYECKIYKQYELEIYTLLHQ